MSEETRSRWLVVEYFYPKMPGSTLNEAIDVLSKSMSAPGKVGADPLKDYEVVNDWILKHGSKYLIRWFALLILFGLIQGAVKTYMPDSSLIFGMRVCEFIIFLHTIYFSWLMAISALIKGRREVGNNHGK